MKRSFGCWLKIVWQGCVGAPHDFSSSKVLATALFPSKNICFSRCSAKELNEKSNAISSKFQKHWSRKNQLLKIWMLQGNEQQENTQGQITFFELMLTCSVFVSSTHLIQVTFHICISLLSSVIQVSQQTTKASTLRTGKHPETKIKVHTWINNTPGALTSVWMGAGLRHLLSFIWLW